MSSFYKKFDEVYLVIEKFLNGFIKSRILQNYFVSAFKSFFYANLINIFFINLNRGNVKELNLPKGKIGQIKREYKDLRKDVKLAMSLKNVKINGDFYNNFKTKVKLDFPEFQKLIQEIEKKIDLERAKEYLKKRIKNIRESGRPDKDLTLSLITTVLESYVQREESLPFGKKLDKLMRFFAKEILPECSHALSQEAMKSIKANSKEMLGFQRKFQAKFESRLYKKWEEPLDLLECLIEVSLESGVEQREKLSKMANGKDNFKAEALLKIHARALQISKEILVLLKAGYADGANSRWRSLHELAVISFFLKDNNDDVSKRYLDHEFVRSFKEAKDYRAHYKELGYLPISRKEFNRIKRKKEKLCMKYRDNFQEGYGWIPSSILSNRNFRALEASVKLSKLHPFYNLSCDSVHGGAKGFYRLGLVSEMQDMVMLVGPSNYGLADPIQNTAISLSHITVCLLNMKPDFETIIQMQIILTYVKEICRKAVDVQESIEKEMASNPSK